MYYACSPNDTFAQLFFAGTETEVPKYSTDGNDMLVLDKEMRERGWRLLELEYDGTCRPPWSAMYISEEEERIGGYADTEPLARGLAAYKALTGEEWVEND